MVTVKIICVGTLKEAYLKEGCNEFIKRLSGFCKLEVIALNEVKTTNEKPGEIEKTLLKEGQKILPYLEGGYNIAMCIEGKQYSSQAFSALMQDITVRGTSRINVIIGGSYGICERVKEKCHTRLSISKMTFTHQMARLLVLEQVYRAFAIQENIKYHK